MRILLLGLVLFVFFGCEKREEDTSFVSYQDTKLTVLKFKKMDDVSPLETNSTSLNTTVHRFKDRILIWVSDSTLKRCVKHHVYFFMNIDNQSYFFETKTNKYGFLLAKIPYEYLDKEIDLNIQSYDKIVNYETTPSKSSSHKSVFPYVKTNKPLYTPQEPIIIHSLAQTYKQGKIFEANPVDTFCLLVISSEKDTVYKNRFTMDKWSSHLDTIQANNLNEGTYFIALYEETQHQKISEQSPHIDIEDRDFMSEYAIQTIYVQNRIASPQKLQIELFDTIVTEEEGVQFSLSLSGSQLPDEQHEVTMRYYFIDKMPHPLNGVRGNVYGIAQYNHMQLELEKTYILEGTKPKIISEVIPFHNDYHQLVIEATVKHKNGRVSHAKEELTGLKKHTQLTIQTEFDDNKWLDTIHAFVQPVYKKTILPHSPVSLSLLYDSTKFLDTTIVTDSKGIAHIRFIADTSKNIVIHAESKEIKNQKELPIGWKRLSPKSQLQVSFDKNAYNWRDTAKIQIEFFEKDYIKYLYKVPYLLQGQSLIDYGEIYFRNNKAELQYVLNEEEGQHHYLFIDSRLKKKIPLSPQIQNLTVLGSYKEHVTVNDTLKGYLKILNFSSIPSRCNISVSLSHIKQQHLTNYLNNKMQNPVVPKPYEYMPISKHQYPLEIHPMAFYGRSWYSNSAIRPTRKLEKGSFSNSKRSQSAKRKSSTKKKGILPSKRRTRVFRGLGQSWMHNRKSYTLYYPNGSPLPVCDSTFHKTFAYSLTEEENYSYFIPNITTDENGEAEFTIPLPDIEGEWILRAIGSDGEGHLIDFTDTIVTTL